MQYYCGMFHKHRIQPAAWIQYYILQVYNCDVETQELQKYSCLYVNSCKNKWTYWFEACLTVFTWLQLIAPYESMHSAWQQSAVSNDVSIYSREELQMFSYIWQVKHSLYMCGHNKAHYFSWVIVKNTCAGCTLRKTQTQRARTLASRRISIRLNALVWALFSVSLSHF